MQCAYRKFPGSGQVLNIFSRLFKSRSAGQHAEDQQPQIVHNIQLYNKAGKTIAAETEKGTDGISQLMKIREAEKNPAEYENNDRVNMLKNRRPVFFAGLSSPVFKDDKYKVIKSP